MPQTLAPLAPLGHFNKVLGTIKAGKTKQLLCEAAPYNLLKTTHLIKTRHPWEGSDVHSVRPEGPETTEALPQNKQEESQKETTKPLYYSLARGMRVEATTPCSTSRPLCCGDLISIDVPPIAFAAGVGTQISHSSLLTWTLAVFRAPGMSSPGLASKKLNGFNWKPIISTGITG